MSSTLAALKDYAWTAHAAVTQCKTLEVAFMDQGLQSSPQNTDLTDTAAELINDILLCGDIRDEAKCKLVNDRVIKPLIC